MLRAAIVTVGDELLLGQTVNTNAAWLGRELAALGVPVVRRHTVADDDGEIRRSVRDALSAADVVLVTGGLGPTPDDITRDSVAKLLGLPLEEDPEVLEDIRRRFRERGVESVPGPNRRVARVPRGATKLANSHGTAPGLALESDGRLVVLLPGVPREMRGIVDKGLRPLLMERFGDRLPPIHLRTIRTTGIPESLLSQHIEQRLHQGTGSVGMAFLPDLRGVDLRLTARGVSEAEAREAFDALEGTLADVLAPWRFEAGGGDLAESVIQALGAHDALLAVAESCTGGLVGARITEIPGASRVFLGGFIAYANEVKTGVLGVSPESLEADGAVSRAVAGQMALGAARALGADAGIGVTGVAGPGGGTDEKPVGTVWYAASWAGAVATRLERFSGDRYAVRERAAQAALFLLLRLLDGRVSPDGAGRG